ncbi:23S rRNA (uracil(1939)-C(5))-methyltransferase RlmD [Myxococcota bacterium]|nr:23S rRNA (uracil(1939)-C(5))-methyltransferase RlmD [Myxococcota bacterium]MBU1380290.1 23S rRNA (uracil(1939)-C(5))-methyltransferase RlmD [Myxococcota bacterium]MBU1498635.1 23S rRNA (uracil(1939)-C(5))-methyltransferase RlmD [Myxococcota bacterium]
MKSKKTKAGRKLPGQCLKTHISANNHDFRGSCICSGYAISVPFAVAGDVAHIVIDAVSSHSPRGFGRIADLNEPSIHRITPLCPFVTECGSCEGAFIDYNYQIQLKKKLLGELFNRNAEFVPSKNRYGWRSKAKFIATAGPDDKTILGSYKPDSHDVFEMLDCVILTDEIRRVLPELRKTVAQIPAYNESTGEGILRSVMLKSGEGVVITFITAVMPSPGIIEDMKSLMGKDGVIGVSLNINPEKTNRLAGKEEILLAGERLVRVSVPGGFQYCDAVSFSQANSSVAFEAYSYIIELAVGKSSVFEIFAGSGGISISLAEAGFDVTALEINPFLTSAGRLSSKKVNFITGDAGDSGLINNILNSKSFDVIVVNPPRGGLDRATVEAIVDSDVNFIIYMSCNPFTLKRDTDLLATSGFELARLRGFDMFPDSHHFETVAGFIRP